MIRFTEREKAELEEQVACGSDDNTFFRRVQVLYWKSQGKSFRELCELSRYSSKSITNFHNRYCKCGLDGLRTHSGGANNRKLSHEEQSVILDKLMEGATVGQYIRGVDLLKRFEELSGVRYSMAGFYTLLYRHGWRKLMPRGQHPKKASDEAIEASKKLT